MAPYSSVEPSVNILAVVSSSCANNAAAGLPGAVIF